MTFHFRRSKFNLLIVALACCFLGTGASAQAQTDGVRLAWKWNAGEKMIIESVQDVSTDMKIQGQEIKSTNTTKTWMTWEVQEADSEGTGTVKSVIDRITIDMNTPMGEIEYDSSKDEENGPQVEMIARNLRPMIGGEITQTVTSGGLVKEISFGESLKKSFSDLGGEAMVRMFEEFTKNATLMFPEEPLKVGDSWERTTTSETPAGNVTLSFTYTYQGLETVESRKLHKFDVDAKMDFATDTVTINDQSTKGEVYFDAEAGRLDHSRVEQDIDMTVSERGQEIRQSIKQVATTVLKKAG